MNDVHMTTVSRLAIAADGYVRDKAAKLVRDAGHKAIMHHYASDATS